MNIAQLTATIESCIMVASLVLLCLKVLPGYRLVAFRQEMFSLRDELFDYAAAGNIRFNDPAYRLLRQSMNGYIRYAHQLTFFRLFVSLVERRALGVEDTKDWHDKWQNSLTSIKNEEIRDRLRDFHSRSMSLAINRVVNGSPVLLSCFIAVAIGLVINEGWRNTKRIINRAAEVTLSKIVSTESIEEAALACGA